MKSLSEQSPMAPLEPSSLERDEKMCSACGASKPRDRDHFEPMAGCRDGFRNKCRECRRRDATLWYEKHGDAKNARKRIQRIDNPEPLREARKRQYHAHADKEREANRRYQLEHRAELSRRENDRLRRNQAVLDGKERWPGGFALVFIDYRDGQWRAAVTGQPLGRYERLVAHFTPHLSLKGFWVVDAAPVLAPALRAWPESLGKRKTRLWQEREQARKAGAKR